MVVLGGGSKRQDKIPLLHHHCVVLIKLLQSMNNGQCMITVINNLRNSVTGLFVLIGNQKELPSLLYFSGTNSIVPNRYSEIANVHFITRKKID